MSRERRSRPPAWLMGRDWPDGSRQAKAQDAWQLRLDGLLLADIAERLGVGRSMVGDLLCDPSGDMARARRHKHHGTCVDCGAPTYNGGSISEPLPIRCQGCERDHPHTLERARRGTGRSHLKWTDEKLFTMLRWAAQRVDGPLTTNKYVDLRATYAFLPSMATITHRFGWKEALAAAGLPTTSTPATSSRLRRITDQQILAGVADCWHERGDPPPADDYQTWAAAHGQPSLGIARVRFGTWVHVLELVEASMREAIAA